MPQAKILINSIPGSNDDLPIAILIQLDNQNIGGETTYQWSIIDQPPGAVDSLSSTTIKNPTFTPKKEGTYLIRIIVNLGLSNEQSNSVVAAIRQLKTHERIPAAGETTEDDVADGWATATNSLFRRIDAELSDNGVIVGVNASGGNLTKGDVLRTTSGAIIKPGLPGQETVPGFSKAPATTLGNLDELLSVMIGGVDGSTTVPDTGLIVVKTLGRVSSISLGSGIVGDTVYVSNTATITITAGSFRRRCGSIMAVIGGGYYDVWFDGVGGIDITPINAPYVVYGAPLTLTNAFRIDGNNATGCAGSVPYLFKAGDVSTAALVARRFGAVAADIFEAQNESGGNLFRIDSTGKVVSIVDITTSANVVANAIGVPGVTSPLVPIHMANALGDKIALTYGSSTSIYGFGLQSNLFQAYINVGSSAFAWGWGASASFTEWMRLNNAGLGIGVVPTWKLQLYTAAAGNDGIRLENSVPRLLQLRPDSTVGANNLMVKAGDCAIWFSGTGATETGRLFIGPWSAASKGIIIDGTTGYIGITVPNTTLPTSKLHIIGSATVGPLEDSAITLENTGTGGIPWRIYSTNAGFSQGAGKLLFYRVGYETASGATMTLTPAGTVAIGATSSSAALGVAANGAVELGSGLSSTFLKVSAGTLGGTIGDSITLASFVCATGNQSQIQIKAYRGKSGSSWTDSFMGIALDVDGSANVGGSTWYSLYGIINCAPNEVVNASIHITAGRAFEWSSPGSTARFAYNSGPTSDGGMYVEIGGNRNDTNTFYGGKLGMYKWRSDGTALAAGHQLGAIWFGGEISNVTSWNENYLRYSASIIALASESWPTSSTCGSELAFLTCPNGGGTSYSKLGLRVADNVGVTRMRILNSGIVTINLNLPYTPSPSAALVVYANNGDPGGFAGIYGVYGYANHPTLASVGVYGESTTTNSSGVVGYANGGLGSVGVHGSAPNVGGANALVAGAIDFACNNFVLKSQATLPPSPIPGTMRFFDTTAGGGTGRGMYIWAQNAGGTYGWRQFGSW